jgi:hypothetical protein
VLFGILYKELVFNGLLQVQGFIYARGPKNAFKKNGDIGRDEKRPPEGEIYKYKAQY